MVKTVAGGRCHIYAQKRAVKAIKEGNRDIILVNAVITEPFSRPPHSYEHSWVEEGGTAYDWQTMEAGMGGNYRGIGFPEKLFYELFKPRNVKKFTPTEYLKFCRVKK